MREKVSAIRNKLPDDIDEPKIAKVDPDATPILFMNLSGNKSVRDLSTYADEVLKEQLQRINGVGDVIFYGLRLRQVRIWLDAAKMQAYQVAPADVVLALKRENIELPGGRIETQTKEYTVRIKGEFAQIPDFNDLIISYYKGAPVKIRDIGRAEDGTEEKRSLSRFNRYSGGRYGNSETIGNQHGRGSQPCEKGSGKNQQNTASRNENQYCRGFSHFLLSVPSTKCNSI